MIYCGRSHNLLFLIEKEMEESLTSNYLDVRLVCCKNEIAIEAGVLEYFAKFIEKHLHWSFNEVAGSATSGSCSVGTLSQYNLKSQWQLPPYYGFNFSLI